MPDNIDFIFKGPEESPGYLLAQVTLLWQRKQKALLDPIGLTHTQFILLATTAWLSNKSENITQVDIANLNNFDRMMVSKVLRTLETKKLITRQEHGTDTRAKIVKITTQGKKVLQLALTQAEKADIDFFALPESRMANFNATLLQLISMNKGDNA